MKTFDDIGFGNLKLVQRKDCFRFGIDAIIAADFAARFSPDAKAAADLGTGNGIIPLVLSEKLSRCHITGFDVQEEAIDLALESRSLNRLEERIDFINSDILNIKKVFPELGRTMDLVISNPPYVAKGSGITNNTSSKFIARQETSATLKDFVEVAAWLLKDKGHFVLVHRPSRLVDIFCEMRRCRIEPKDIRLVSPRSGEIPNIVLVHGILGGGQQLDFMENLNVYAENNEYSYEINRIYGRNG